MNYVDCLKNLRKALSPIKLSVEAMSRRDANLLQAESVIKFSLDKLKKLETNVSLRLYDALKERMISRRNTEAISTLKYLHDPASYKDAVKNEHNLLESTIARKKKF